MIGLLLSLLISASPVVPATAASLTCPDDPASCDAAWVGPVAARADEGPREYATPAEVDCPAPVLAEIPGAPPGPVQLSECDAPPDLWYRASRLVDGPFRKDGKLLPAKQRREARAASSFDPPREPASLTAPDLQPVALFALPILSPPERPSGAPAAEVESPGRALAPPDRPPRA
jgi:hypothetical protein